jgi:hypothetical protein
VLGSFDPTLREYAARYALALPCVCYRCGWLMQPTFHVMCSCAMA